MRRNDKYQARDKEVLKNTSSGLHKENLHTEDAKRISKKELEESFDAKDVDSVALGKHSVENPGEAKKTNGILNVTGAASAARSIADMRDEDSGQDQDTKNIIRTGISTGVNNSKELAGKVRKVATDILEAEDTGSGDHFSDDVRAGEYHGDGIRYEDSSGSKPSYDNRSKNEPTYDSRSENGLGSDSERDQKHRHDSLAGQEQRYDVQAGQGQKRDAWPDQEQKPDYFTRGTAYRDESQRKTAFRSERNKETPQVSDTKKTRSGKNQSLHSFQRADLSLLESEGTAFTEDVRHEGTSESVHSNAFKEQPGFAENIHQEPESAADKGSQRELFAREKYIFPSEDDGLVRYSEGADDSDYIFEKRPDKKRFAQRYRQNKRDIGEATDDVQSDHSIHEADNSLVLGRDAVEEVAGRETRSSEVIRPWRTDSGQRNRVYHDPEYQAVPEIDKPQSRLKFREDTESTYVRDVFWDTDKAVSRTESRDIINRTDISTYDGKGRDTRLVFSDTPPSDRSFRRMQGFVSVQTGERPVRHFSDKLHDFRSAGSIPGQMSSKNLNKEIQKKRYKRSLLARFSLKETQNSIVLSTPSQAIKQASGSIFKNTIVHTVSGLKPVIAVIVVIVLMLSLVLSSMTGCTAIIGGGAVIMASTFPSSDEDIVSVDAEYSRLERELDDQINRMEQTHPGMDEMYCPLPVVGGQSSGSLEDHASHDDPSYAYQVDEITHNPFQLAAILSAKFGNYRPMDVIGELRVILELQYTLTVRERTEIRQKEVTDPVTGKTKTKDYRADVLYVTLTNHGLDYAARQYLTPDQLALYEAYVATKGNKKDLFDENSITVSPAGGGTGGATYDVPPEALSDARFRNMLNEAEKYLGMPYVWGGSTPATSFDCSGFVSWVVNHCGNGWNVGRQTAEGLRRLCTYVSIEDARPGDLIFFQGTYNTSGASHIGIYVGNGMMIHAGKPIQYANVNTPYFKSHFYQYGRLP